MNLAREFTTKKEVNHEIQNRSDVNSEKVPTCSDSHRKHHRRQWISCGACTALVAARFQHIFFIGTCLSRKHQGLPARASLFVLPKITKHSSSLSGTQPGVIVIWFVPQLMATQEGDEEDLRKKKVRQGQWQFLCWVKQSKPAPETHHILNMGDCFCQRLDWKGCMFLLFF